MGRRATAVDSETAADQEKQTFGAARERATRIVREAQRASAAAVLRGGLVVDANSVAVLAFGERDASDRGAGVTEIAAGLQRGLIAAFAEIPGVYAIPAASVLPYADTELAPGAIGAELGARGILTGDVAVVDGTLRIRVVLDDAVTNGVRWRHDYEAPLAQLSRIQGEIVEGVTAALVGAPRYDETLAAIAPAP
jgi:TolB-like protein